MANPTRIQWADISAAARETSEDLNGKDWVQAGIKARVLLADLADEVDRLRAELRAVADLLDEALTTPDKSRREKILGMAEARARDAAEGSGGPTT